VCGLKKNILRSASRGDRTENRSIVREYRLTSEKLVNNLVS